MCTNLIPATRKKDAVTCSPECTKARRDFFRSRIDQEKCRYCNRPSSVEERVNYGRWKRWIKTHDEDSIEGRMTHEEKIYRAMKLAGEEMRDNPKHWMYLSFAGVNDFNGAVFIEAFGLITAIIRCNELGINPHGEVVGVDVPEGGLPAEEYRNRVLSLEDLQAAGLEPRKLTELEHEAEQEEQA
jgi:hypothetical protein